MTVAMRSPWVAMGMQRRESVSPATRIQKDFIESELLLGRLKFK